MKNIKITAPHALLAVAAMVLNIGVTVDWLPATAPGFQPASIHIVLMNTARAADGDGDGGDGGDGDGGDGDSDGSGDAGDNNDGDSADHDADADDGEDADTETDTEEDSDLDSLEDDPDDMAIDTERDISLSSGYGASGGIGYVRGEVIGVAVTAAGRDTIDRLGANIVEADRFPALGITITHVRTRGGVGAAALQARLNASGTGIYDLNHTYHPAATSGASHANPLQLLHWAGRPDWCGQNVRLGIIDTAVNLKPLGGHAAQVRMRRFAPGPSLNSAHGSAILDLLLGTTTGPRGALPAARVLVADVYRTDKQGQPLALTTDLIAALNWLATQDIQVINMSLAGPPNRLLKRAIKQLRQQGRVVVAAAGNRGPLAPPAYPAAYEDVVAVTAVNAQLNVFPRANRGFYIDLAAPGVGLTVARGQQASGTSLATIYVSAALADAVASGTDTGTAVRQLLSNARDLGQSGWDSTFGDGLLLSSLSCSH